MARSSASNAAPWGLMGLLAYIGAAIYFIDTGAGGFGGVVLGLLQAIVWPVFAVYHGFAALGT